MHEQNSENIVEKLTAEKAGEVLNGKVKMAVLDMLKRKGPSSFGDIIRNLGVSQPAGTNHILELKLLGLIEKSVDPPNFNINAGRYEMLLRHRNE